MPTYSDWALALAVPNFVGPRLCLTPLTRAKHFADSEVSLPVHPYLSDEDVDRVINACNDWSV